MEGNAPEGVTYQVVEKYGGNHHKDNAVRWLSLRTINTEKNNEMLKRIHQQLKTECTSQKTSLGAHGDTLIPCTWRKGKAEDQYVV